MNGSQHITLELPEAEIAFVRSFAERNKMTIDDVISLLIRSLQRATNRRPDLMEDSFALIAIAATDTVQLILAE